MTAATHRTIVSVASSAALAVSAAAITSVAILTLDGGSMPYPRKRFQVQFIHIIDSMHMRRVAAAAKYKKRPPVARGAHSS